VGDAGPYQEGAEAADGVEEAEHAVDLAPQKPLERETGEGAGGQRHEEE
jgi:hypothetical protein